MQLRGRADPITPGLQDLNATIRFMSTPNFSYQNRCVLVTNNDYELGNIPETSTVKNLGNRYYSSVKVDDDQYPQATPIAHTIVITSGYYSDSCLDFIEKPDFTVEDYLCRWLYQFDSVEDFISELKENIGSVLSTYRIRQLLGKRGDTDLETHLRRGVDRINEYLTDRDKDLCNEIVDHLKDAYGYRELVCTAVFSNGEAMYDFLDTAGLRKKVKAS